MMSSGNVDYSIFNTMDDNRLIEIVAIVNRLIIVLLNNKADTGTIIKVNYTAVAPGDAS